MPGSSPSTPRTPPVTARVRGFSSNWLTICPPMSCSLETRVTMMAAAVDSTNEGSWATKPSPMVSKV